MSQVFLVGRSFSIFEKKEKRERKLSAALVQANSFDDLALNPFEVDFKGTNSSNNNKSKEAGKSSFSTRVELVLYDDANGLNFSCSILTRPEPILVERLAGWLAESSKWIGLVDRLLLVARPPTDLRLIQCLWPPSRATDTEASVVGGGLVVV